MSKEVVEPIKNQPNYELVRRIEPYTFIRCIESGYIQLKSIYTVNHLFNPEFNIVDSEDKILNDEFVQEMITILEKDINEPLLNFSVVEPYTGYYIHPKLVNPIASYLIPNYLTKLYHPRMSTKSNEEFDDDDFKFSRLFHPYSFIIHQKDNYVQFESIINAFNLKLTVQQVMEMDKIKEVFKIIQDEISNKYKLNEPIIKVIHTYKASLTNGTYVHPFIHTFIAAYLKPEIMIRMAK